MIFMNRKVRYKLNGETFLKENEVVCILLIIKINILLSPLEQYRNIIYFGTYCDSMLSKKNE